MPLKGMYHRKPLCHATVSVLLLAHACRRHVFRPVPRLLRAHHPNSSIPDPTCSCPRLPSYDTYQRYASSVYQPSENPFHRFLAISLAVTPIPSSREERRWQSDVSDAEGHNRLDHLVRIAKPRRTLRIRAPSRRLDHFQGNVSPSRRTTLSFTGQDGARTLDRLAARRCRRPPTPLLPHPCPRSSGPGPIPPRMALALVRPPLSRLRSRVRLAALTRTRYSRDVSHA